MKQHCPALHSKLTRATEKFVFLGLTYFYFFGSDVVISRIEIIEIFSREFAERFYSACCGTFICV